MNGLKNIIIKILTLLKKSEKLTWMVSESALGRKVKNFYIYLVSFNKNKSGKEFSYHFYPAHYQHTKKQYLTKNAFCYILLK